MSSSKLSFLCVFLGIFASFIECAATVYGPDFIPPFEIKQGERVDGELRTMTFLDKNREDHPEITATIASGNKRVTTREIIVTITRSFG